MDKKLKERQIRRIFKTMAQGRPPEEQIYIKGLMRKVLARTAKKALKL